MKKTKPKKKKIIKPVLKKFFVSLCYSVPVNCEGYIMAKDENDATRKANEASLEGNGELTDDIFWNEATPNYKINKRTPSDSDGVYVEEKEECGEDEDKCCSCGKIPDADGRCKCTNKDANY